MSVQSSLNVLGQQRVDVTDLKSVDSSVISDFKTLLQAFQGSTPYILKGFKLLVAGISGPATSLQMQVSDSIVWIPNDPAGPFLKVASGTANEILNSANSKVIGSFSPGINYVGIRFKRATDPSTNDLVSLWDVDSKVEFTKTAPRGLILSYEIVISSTSFGDTAPIAKVTVSGSTVTQIENAKQNLFRLGSGGASPDINHQYSLVTDPENPIIATSNSDPDPFAGGDWELSSFKDWMNLVMTEIKKMKGTSYWYTSASSAPVSNLNLLNLHFDSVGSVITGSGRFEHDEVTPGLVSWSSQIKIQSVIGNLYYLINPGNFTLNDGQVAYISLVREQDFQPSNTFTFTNGSNIVSASLPVGTLVAGDWIKYVSHSATKWARVLSVLGSTVTLTANYEGATVVGKALRSQGLYTVSVANASSVPADANTFWIAKRQDSGVPTATIETIANSGAMRTSDVATITTTAAHGLVAGETVSVTGVNDTSFNEVVEIDSVPSSTTFTYYNPGIDVPAVTAGGGSVSTRAKVYLRALGELVQGEERQIDDNAVLNLLKFVGSESETDITPPYTVFPNALSPYTFTQNDNLTKAISVTTANINAILLTLDLPSYDETQQIAAPITSGTNITIPVNTRLTGSPQQYYTVGKGTLELYLNGQYLILGTTNGWTEVGISGAASSTIQIQQDLEVGDTLTFRLDANGGPNAGGSSAPDDDFATLPTSSTPDMADFVLTYDVSANAYRKQTRATFLSGVSNSKNIVTKTANYTADVNNDDVILVDASAGPVTITLPAAASSDGKEFNIKKIDATANSVIIDANAAEVIDNALTISTTTQYENFTIVCDAIKWWII